MLRMSMRKVSTQNVFFGAWHDQRSLKILLDSMDIHRDALQYEILYEFLNFLALKRIWRNQDAEIGNLIKTRLRKLGNVLLQCMHWACIQYGLACG